MKILVATGYCEWSTRAHSLKAKAMMLTDPAMISAVEHYRAVNDSKAWDNLVQTFRYLKFRVLQATGEVLDPTLEPLETIEVLNVESDFRIGTFEDGGEYLVLPEEEDNSWTPKKLEALTTPEPDLKLLALADEG